MRKILPIVMLFFIGLTLTGYTNQETMKEIVVKDAIEIGSSFHENYAQCRTDLSQNIGFINTDGEICINAKYSLASNFSEGLAAVIQDGELCYINTDGDAVLKTQLSPSDFVFDDPWYNKEEHFPIQSFDFSCDRALKFDSASKKWGFMNKRGETIISCEYDHVEQFQDGLAVVKKDGKFGVIDKNNQYIIELGKYQMIENIGSGFIAASNQLDELNLMEEFSLIDDTGRMIKTRIEGYVIANVSEECFAVEQDERITIYDTAGSKRFSLPVFEDEPFRMLCNVESSNEGIMLVEYWYENSGEYKYGYIDSKTGKMLIEPQYDNAFSFSDGVAVVEMHGNYGAIDRENGIVIPFQYDNWGYINSFTPVYSFKGYIPLLKMGKRVIVKYNAGTKIDLETDVKDGIDAKEDNTLTAVPISSEVIVEGKTVAFCAYNIQGNNYFKLRDLAAAFNGANKQFSVEWDHTQQTIRLQENQPYSGTLTKETVLVPQKAVASNVTLYKNDERISWIAYNINGNTYVKLRDVSAVFGFPVYWDAEKNQITI